MPMTAREHSEASRYRLADLARWDSDGGASPDGPQVTSQYSNTRNIDASLIDSGTPNLGVRINAPDNRAAGTPKLALTIPIVNPEVT
jgi:hypothetical protein